MTDLIAMFANLSQSLPSVQAMLGGVSYVFGMICIISGIMRFKENADKGQGGGGSKSHMTIPTAYVLAGSALLFLPTTFDAFSNTLFGSGSSVLQYAGYQPYDIYSAMTILIETIGIIWVIRGCVLLAHASHPEGGQEGSKGFGFKGFLFVVAGIFAINFHSTVDMMDTVMNYLIDLSSGGEPS
ncbi:MAG: DUF308 domain-containing protein [Gammaproteobacteria bacterium]|nr:DUF308 domain-containing protein [Gammaproteobacteria bacterium]